MSMVKEFKEFISRGNVVALAVGVIIGGAFGAIVNSLVKDVVMPPIGYLTSGINFDSLKYTIPGTELSHPDPAHPGQMILDKAGVSIGYGAFINTIITFLIISAVIFLVVKGVNSLKRKEAVAPSTPPVPTPEEKLLTEIRDLLAKRP
jgi:large conductance mechanosensitive channel